MAKMGRKPILTPELQKEICTNIAIGLTFQDACLKCHIGRSTFITWREKGEREASGRHRDFLEAVAVAEAGFKATHLTTIKKASKGKVPGQWQAAAWLLERKYPAEFSMRQQVAISDKLEQFVKAFDEIV